MPDDKHEQLKAAARERKTRMNRLVDEMATLMIAEHDAETRFRVRAQRGQGREQEGLALLDKAMGNTSPH
ncbi:hypothetical protein TVD_07060 [Thioalkalivibrio versutus]|uniref:Toxin-antitoxin system HicB family antitoxin n=1 Tax=Thioalkalivibrio versutus TaxID=106634 RepID=A0A0G3G443_9GAMM|nr:hypothetical protein [Thioalkalivibrio versutus]AKJ95134.1 hypothetical protein TVD_07060 [Thioalkalivibrio versutus]